MEYWNALLGTRWLQLKCLNTGLMTSFHLIYPHWYASCKYIVWFMILFVFEGGCLYLLSFALSRENCKFTLWNTVYCRYICFPFSLDVNQGTTTAIATALPQSCLTLKPIGKQCMANVLKVQQILFLISILQVSSHSGPQERRSFLSLVGKCVLCCPHGRKSCVLKMHCDVT